VPGPAEIIHTSSDAGWQHCTNCGNGELFNNPSSSNTFVVPDRVDVTN